MATLVDLRSRILKHDMVRDSSPSYILVLKCETTYLIFQKCDMLARDFLLICGRTHIHCNMKATTVKETGRISALSQYVPSSCWLCWCRHDVQLPKPHLSASRRLHIPETDKSIPRKISNDWQMQAISSLTITVCILIISITFLLSDLLCFVLFFSLPQKLVCFVTYSTMVVPFW